MAKRYAKTVEELGSIVGRATPTLAKYARLGCPCSAKCRDNKGRYNVAKVVIWMKQSGFADASGGGEFFAALRSCLLAGGEARLFAGAGIVQGSEPELELRETRLKLRAMLAPLFEL